MRAITYKTKKIQWMTKEASRLRPCEHRNQ